MNPAMTQANLAPERAAQLPLLPEWRAELADLLLRGASYFAVAQRLGPLVEEMKKSHGGRLDQAVRQIQYIMDPEGKGTNLLLHSIPRPVLVSLLLGTVAYDQANTPLEQYSLDGSGVYVVGISLEAHNGAFLTGDEMAAFVRALERYTTEAGAFLRHDNDKDEEDDDEDDDGRPPRSSFMVDADNQYGIYTARVPRFIKSQTSLKAMRVFLASMKRRLQAIQRADPSGSKRSHQSPLYIGCAINIKTRGIAYGSRQFRSAFEAVNHPFGLTMSLLHMANLGPREHVITVLRTWLPGQLSEAESLVAALAGSYVEQSGFNVQICGQHKQEPGASSDADAAMYVLVTAPHLTQNMEASTREVASLKNMAAVMDKTETELAHHAVNAAARTAASRSIQEQMDLCDRLCSQIDELQESAQRAIRTEQVQMLEDECEDARARRRVIEEIAEAYGKQQGEDNVE